MNLSLTTHGVSGPSGTVTRGCWRLLQPFAELVKNKQNISVTLSMVRVKLSEAVDGNTSLIYCSHHERPGQCKRIRKSKQLVKSAQYSIDFILTIQFNQMTFYQNI